MPNFQKVFKEFDFSEEFFLNRGPNSIRYCISGVGLFVSCFFQISEANGFTKDVMHLTADLTQGGLGGETLL